MTGRFAPSPSGRMHLGNVFSALMAWLCVRSAGGKLVLRIEDLDVQRCKPEYAQQLKDDLRFLGLTWDEEQTPQSQKTAYYGEMFQKLMEMGLVYPCFCTRAERLAASAPHDTDGSYLYPGTCRDLTEAERAGKTRTPAWRLKVGDRSFGGVDLLQGPFDQDLKTACGDFILRRADGVFAYQLAVVADDIQAGVTQVVRGRDLLSSTPRQMYLYELFGAAHPGYLHLPLLTDGQGRRLSKRDGDLDMGELRKSWTAEELLGALAQAAGLLEKREAISAKELISVFDEKKLRKEDIPIREFLV